MCGGNDLMKQEGVFVCQSCGSKYTVEEARRMMVEVEGTVDVTGSTVKVDNSTKLENLYKVARRAVEDGNTDQAFKKYEQLQMEDPDNWEPNFYTAYYSGINSLKNDSPGSSVRISGGKVSLSLNYRSGISPCIRTIHNCLDSIFSLIEDIQDYDKQNAAIETVQGNVESIADILMDIIDSEHQRMKGEISHYADEVNEGFVGKGIDKMTLGGKNNDIRDSYKQDVSIMLALVEKRKDRIEEIVGKQRFDEFWAENQPLKANLETEKKTLTEKIEALNKEISSTPQNTEGYAHMVELQKKVKNLISEKEALGFFKFKEKKVVQEQIDSVSAEIDPIQLRINSAILEVEKRINSHQTRIKDIDEELTKPR